MTKLGERLLKSAQEARAIARGEMEPGRVFTPPSVDVAEIRRKTGLSQERLPSGSGSLRPLSAIGSKKRRTPRCRSQTLLIVIDREPAAVERALSSEPHDLRHGENGHLTLSRTCPGFGAAARWSGHVPLHAIDEGPAATHPRLPGFGEPGSMT